MKRIIKTMIILIIGLILVVSVEGMNNENEDRPNDKYAGDVCEIG